MGGRRARAGAPPGQLHSTGAEPPAPGRRKASGSPPPLEGVRESGGHLQTQNGDSWLPFTTVLLGLLWASVYPSVGKEPPLVSPLWDARQLWSPVSLRQGDSLSPEPPAPASGSSIQPERIKEGSEKINKHVGKTQTNPAAANEANSLYANRCLALTRPLGSEDATCWHQLRSARRALPVPGSPQGFNVSR